MPNNDNKGLQNIFGKLKNQIVGTKTTNIDQKLDTAIKDITSYRTHTDQQNYIELIRNLISRSQGGDLGSNSGLFTQHGDSSPAALGQGLRLKRYKLYESIVSNITYCKRALNVLVENILAPDDITKVSLEITPKSYIEDEVDTESKIKKLRHIIAQVKLEESLDIICNNTLKYGDYFCEIADNKTAMTSRSFLVESELLRDVQSGQSNKSVAYSNQDFTININYESLYEKQKNGKKKKKEEDKDEYNINELSLVLHEPNRVVKLQSDLYPICFGYLIFPRYAGQGGMGGYYQQQPIDDICAGILKDLQRNIPQASELEKDDELKEIISSMVSNSRSQTMNIRYVPPNRMTHFMVPSTKFHPYGESIFDAVQFDCKVLMAMQTAIAVQRINKSTEKRKIGIELGLPRDATNQIQELKETFRKRKVNLDSFETVDTISSAINTFEDIYVPQRDGRPYVDIENLDAGTTDVRSKVDELKFIRDNIISGLSVPAPFLSIDEDLQSRCVSLNTKIPLVSGGEKTVSELIDEYENDNLGNKYVYSYDQENNKIVAGKIIWAGKTRLNTDVVRVTFDNEESEIVTPDHKFMLRDGSYKEAKDLEPNDSLMPLYTKLSHSKTTTRNIPYVVVYQPGGGYWEPLHRAIAKQYCYVEDGDGLNVHHINFNPMDNSPENLEGLSIFEHVNKHIEHKHFITTGRGNVKKENYVTENCQVCGKEYIRHIGNDQITCLSGECIREIRRINGKKSWKKQKSKVQKYDEVKVVCPFCGLEFYRPQNYVDEIKTITCGRSPCYEKGLKKTRSDPKVRQDTIEAGRKGGYKGGKATKGKNKKNNPEKFEKMRKTMLANWGTTNMAEIKRMKKEKEDRNHKVVKVEWLKENIDTGDITIEKYHNFATSSGIIVHNSTLSEENMLFARTVVNHQKYLSEQIRDLLYKMYYLIDSENALTIFDNVEISLPSPRNMQFERQSKAMQDAINLIESLERVDVPKEWAKKNFLPSLDWNEIENYEIDEKIDKKLGTEGEEDEEGGVGGGMSF